MTDLINQLREELRATNLRITFLQEALSDYLNCDLNYLVEKLEWERDYFGQRND